MPEQSPDIDDMAMEAALARQIDDPKDHEPFEGINACYRLYVDRTKFTEIKETMERLFGPYETQQAIKRAERTAEMLLPKRNQ